MSRGSFREDLRAVVPRSPEKGRHGLFRVTAAEHFAPIDAMDRPAEFGEGELLRRVTAEQGVQIARRFNQRQLATGLPDRQWLIVVFSLRPRRGKGGAR